MTRRFSSDRYSLSRIPSHDQAGGNAPFEDLRRRLAAINGSNTSLNSAGARDRPMLQKFPTAVPELPPSVPLRPSSPTESVVSTSNSVSLMPRFSIGSADGAKAAPAVGSVRTNAVGLLEAPGRLHADSERDASGINSPIPRGMRSPISSVQEGK